MTPDEGPWSSSADSQPDWSEATSQLSRRDPVLGALIRRIGPCTLAPRPNSFGMLVGSIVAQQISAAAARTIHKRLWALTRREPEASGHPLAAASHAVRSQLGQRETPH